MDSARKNHFEIFSIDPVFGLDEAALTQAFRRVQSAVHPDRFVNAGPSERRYAVALAAQVNEAYRTLSDPPRRAAYLCELNGVAVAAEDNTSMPAGFLVEQMEWREALDQALEERDLAAIEAMDTRNRQVRQSLQDQLRELIDVDRDFERAAALIRRIMFIDRFALQLQASRQALAG